MIAGLANHKIEKNKNKKKNPAQTSAAHTFIPMNMPLILTLTSILSQTHLTFCLK
jgi:hypothetical protein